MENRSPSRRLTLFRSCVFVVLAAFTVPVTLVGCLAAGWPLPITIPVTVIVLLLILLATVRIVPALLADQRAKHRFLFVAWAALSLFVSFRLAGMSVFMLDADKAEYAVNASVSTLWTVSGPKPEGRQHNCFTAYVIAADRAAQNVENIYQSQPSDEESATETVVDQGVRDRFTIDPYLYPPPFLILPRLMLATGADFYQARTYWFVLNILVFTVAVGSLVAWLGGREFNRYWFLWPLLLIAPAMLRTLQGGNLHLLVISLSLLAMVAIKRNRNWLGGGLLGFAIVCKVFPALLLAYLLVRRRWNAVIWTLAGILAFCSITVLLFGIQPFDSFVNYHLPRLVTGEAVGFATKASGAIKSNLSVAGIPYKMEKLDMLASCDPAAVARVLRWIYTGILAGVIILLGFTNRRSAPFDSAVGNRGTGRMMQAQLWLALLILAQLLSPFLPWGYSNVPILWLLTLLALGSNSWSRWTGFLIAGWVVFAVKRPEFLGLETETAHLIYGLTIQTLLIIGCLAFVVRQAVDRDPTPKNRFRLLSERQAR